jgi:hypothetical protein
MDRVSAEFFYDPDGLRGNVETANGVRPSIDCTGVHSASAVVADARLYKTSYGKGSKLSYLGHALVENRNRLIAAAMVTHADGYAERDAVLLMLAEKQEGRSRRITVVADKTYNTKDFLLEASDPAMLALVHPR